MKLVIKECWNYINRSIRRRLFFNFLFISLVPLIILQMISVSINNSHMRQETLSYTVSEVETLLYDMEHTFQSVEDVCNSILNDAVFQQYMRNSYPNEAERYSADLQGSMGLASIVANQQDIFGLYLLGENKFCGKSNTYSFLRGDYRNDSWFRETMQRNVPTWYSFHEESYVTKTAGKLFISMSVPYVDKATGGYNGVIMVDIEEEIITSQLHRKLGGKGFFLLLDDDSHLLYNSNNGQVGDVLMRHVLENIPSNQTNEVSAKTASVKMTEQALIVCQKSEATNWMLISVVPADSINSALQSIWVMTIIMALFIAVLAVTLSSLLSQKYTAPLIRMEAAMKSVEEGDLSVKLVPIGEDEISRASENFNHMVSRIRKLINLNFEKQRQLRKAEYRALQAQINPHFLYNSLDSIVWLLRMNEKEKAIIMLQNLIVLFRVSLSKGSELIPLQKELQHLTSYLTIQSMRYNRKFDYSVETDDGILKYYTLKLILQPLVENSIYHGLSSNRPHVHLLVELRDIGDKLMFRVSDDGAGMSAETLERLRESINLPDKENKKGSEIDGYGLGNINGRIKVYFGNDYGMTIDSEENVKTVVTLTIPKFIGDKILMPGRSEENGKI